MAAAQEEFSFGAKASKAVWVTVSALLLTGAGIGIGAGITGAKAPEPQSMATIGAVTSAAESRAQSVAFAESSKLRTEVQGDLSRHKSDLADALKRLTDIQAKQADDLSTIKVDLSRIAGQLEGLPARRR